VERYLVRCLLVSITLLGLCLKAHEIPSDATVHVFAKPAGNSFTVLVRVPLKTMRDVQFPEQTSGYLDVRQLEPMLADMATVWLSTFIDVYENDVQLAKPRLMATQISIASDRSFAGFDQALAHIKEAKPGNSEYLVWNQVWLDAQFETPIHSDRSAFSIHPRLGHLANRVVTVLRFVPPGSDIRAFEFEGDPGIVPLDPRWTQAAFRFVELGFRHILDGTDHLLFLLCLVIPFRRLRPLLLVVTAFTVAHSVTLIASAYQWRPDALWFPPLIETLIAASIVYMAFENIMGASAVSRRWMMAFGFGLVHGFGFSFALEQTLQFAGSHLLTSLLSFNIGVELGQILVLLLSIPLLDLLFRVVPSERTASIILSALVAHTGWHWMTDRWDRLRQFQFEWPAMDAAGLAMALRWIVALLLVGALIRMMTRVRAPKTSA
jgi:hypothetical protein